MSLELSPRLAVEMIIRAGLDVRGTWNQKLNLENCFETKTGKIMKSRKLKNRDSAIEWFTNGDIGEFTFNECLDQLGWNRDWVFRHIDVIVSGDFIERLTVIKTVTEEFKFNRTKRRW